MDIMVNQQALFALVKAGLWDKKAGLSHFEKVDYEKVYRLAQEQSVVGLVAAGLEHVSDVVIPKGCALAFVGEALQLEQRNLAMNKFVNRVLGLLNDKGIHALLVKGQGIAQCYKKPLWRASGDVDLLLEKTEYEKAKSVLLPLARSAETEYQSIMHFGMKMEDGFVVELHGTLHTRLSRRMDRFIDGLQEETFHDSSFHIWRNHEVDVLMPSIDNDVIFLFSHILHHFYIEGIGLRQICDWCRFLWTYRNELDVVLLESRLKAMRIMSEWLAFAAMAVDWLGMPVEAMPLYSFDKKWSRKAARIVSFVLMCGNFGHNRPSTRGKVNSACRKVKDFARHIRVFPVDSVKFLFHFIGNGLMLAIETGRRTY